MKIWMMMFVAISLLVSIASCQNYAWRALAWDYDFSQYPDDSIHFIIYQKAETDTGFFAYDTTEANTLEWNLLEHRSLYDFKWRSFFATAIEYNGDDFNNPVDSLFSYESAPSDTISEYFRRLPPGSIGSKIKFDKIKIEDIPQL